MDQKELKELREYYDNTDTSAEIADAELDDEIVTAPMVGITVRLPAEVLQRVRERAAQENIKTTALIRQWVEERIQPTSLFGGFSLMPLSVAGVGPVTCINQSALELHAGSPALWQTREWLEEAAETFGRIFGEDRVST